MENRKLQAALNAIGLTPPLIADGIPGKKTMAAIEGLLSAEKVPGFANWSDARLLIAAEQLVYQKQSIEVGTIDGLVGEQTRYARTVYLARLAGDKKVETWRDANPPAPAGHPAPPTAARSKIIWPKQHETEMDRFFGAKGTNQKRLTMPFPLRIAWEPQRQVTSFECNVKVHDPMLRIWTNVLQHYGYDEIKRLRLDMYGGCLNVRKMRGGSAWSIHSWGCAIDVDPDRNQLKFHRAQATLDDAPYKKYWELVYAEGAIGLGPERDYDWMHFQFARL